MLVKIIVSIVLCLSGAFTCLVLPRKIQAFYRQYGRSEEVKRLVESKWYLPTLGALGTVLLFLALAVLWIFVTGKAGA